MAEFYFPSDVRMRQAELQTLLEEELGMSILSPMLLVSDMYPNKRSRASDNLFNLLDEVLAKLRRMSSLQRVEVLIYFFRGLLQRTDAIDKKNNTPLNRSMCERIKMLIHLLVNTEIHVQQFAQLVKCVVRTSANPNFFPFLQETVPAFIDAVTECRVNVECLVPYYLKPYIPLIGTRTYQGFYIPSMEIPATVAPFFPRRIRQFGLDWLNFKYGASVALEAAPTQKTRNLGAEVLSSDESSSESDVSTDSDDISDESAVSSFSPLKIPVSSTNAVVTTSNLPRALCIFPQLL